MKLSDIKQGQTYQRKKPFSHTEKLIKLEVIRITSYYETTNILIPGKGWKKRNKSYVVSKVSEGQFYPAANHGYLDGLIDMTPLSEFKANYKLIN